MKTLQQHLDTQKRISLSHIQALNINKEYSVFKKQLSPLK